MTSGLRLSHQWEPAEIDAVFSRTGHTSSEAPGGVILIHGGFAGYKKKYFF
jgi:hypothetical protein